MLEDRITPAVISVTTAADDNTPNDGSVSLREAIQAINNGSAGADTDISNQNPGVFGVNDTIKFNISVSGTIQTIRVGSTGNGALPALLKPMTIDGYSETGASRNTLANGDNAKILVELDGSNAGPNADGLLIGFTSAGSTIEGLAINRFSLNGLELQGGGDTIAGNFVGTNPQGNAAEPNQNDGIHISNSSSSTIGGTTPEARNIASGNQIDGIHIVGTTASPATGNLIEGNFVGVNASGTGSVGIKAIGSAVGTPAGNFVFGIEISGGNANTVGGAVSADRNVIGFNVDGIEIDNGGENNVIQGNFSGVGADGVTPVGNNLHGIVLRSDDNLPPPLGPGQANEPAVSGNIIGLNPNTNFSGLGNLVEFNGTAGIAVFDNPLPNNATPIQNSAQFHPRQLDLREWPRQPDVFTRHRPLELLRLRQGRRRHAQRFQGPRRRQRPQQFPERPSVDRCVGLRRQCHHHWHAHAERLAQHEIPHRILRQQPRPAGRSPRGPDLPRRHQRDDQRQRPGLLFDHPQPQRERRPDHHGDRDQPHAGPVGAGGQHVHPVQHLGVLRRADAAGRR